MLKTLVPALLLCLFLAAPARGETLRLAPARGEMLRLAPARGETVYATPIEDLPLMQGMQEIPDSIVVFDKADGRIVDFEAASAAGAAEVQAFYDSALPPLGWQKTAPGQYVRGAETLSITLDAQRLVHFSLKPKGK